MESWHYLKATESREMLFKYYINLLCLSELTRSNLKQVTVSFISTNCPSLNIITMKEADFHEVKVVKNGSSKSFWKTAFEKFEVTWFSTNFCSTNLVHSRILWTILYHWSFSIRTENNKKTQKPVPWNESVTDFGTFKTVKKPWENHPRKPIWLFFYKQYHFISSSFSWSVWNKTKKLIW